MSKSKIDSDGFQTVFSKRFSRNKQTKIPRKGSNFIENTPEINVEKSKQRILFSFDDLQGSKYLEDAITSVKSLIQGRSISEIVCFGLGHIGDCNISRYQLAFLLHLKDSLLPHKVFVHDPIFYKSECEILKGFSLDLIEVNYEGSYVTSDQNLTLVYLPHCPKQLTNNFLWSNWGCNLKNCIIICNSFSSLIENQPSSIISDVVPYIYKISSYITEIKLENSFKFSDIFNDTSIHYFTDKLDELSSEFWQKGEKPSYQNHEEFITSLMVEKLNI